MYYKNELDFMPGIYKCYGDIKFSRFKICLEIVKTAMIPLSDIEEQETGLDPQFNEKEELIFSWNEKVFSSHEIQRYSNLSNCLTKVEKEYNDKIKSSLSGNIVTKNCLFTYTTEDEIPDTLFRDILYEGECCKFHQKNNLSASFRRNLYVTSEKSDAFSLPVRNIVDNYPSNQLKTQNRSLFHDFQTMYVVADLSNKNQNSDSSTRNNNEHLLVSLKWNEKSHTLVVIPDFISFKTCGYKIDCDTVNDARSIYRYWISNFSQTNEQNYFERFDKLTDKLSQQSNLPQHLHFEIPVKDTLDIYLFVEIQKAVGFTYDNLFIQYFIFLPTGWSTDDSQLLSGVTQQCRIGKNNTASFSFAFELKLSINFTDFDENAFPQFFFEICSLDSWKQLRIEGYTWLQLPKTVGRHKFNLTTWRQATVKCKDNLRRFFIGADPEILDFTYPGIPSEKSNNLLSRYGFETVSSGDIHLELNIVHQTGQELMPSYSSSQLINKLSGTTLINNVNHILVAFKKARQRMLLAREPILHQADETETIEP